LVRALGVRKVGAGGGTEHEEIEVFLVPRAEIPAFVASRRALGVAVDVKLLNFLNF
jgi:ADP-ribose pyrophosphatase